MGKGDRRTKRGKIFQGTSGKSRPKPEKSERSRKSSSSEKKQS